MNKLTREQMAERLAQDIEPGSYVNIGIGMPTLVANYLDPADEILLQSENGILGMGPRAKEDEIDLELINAGKQPVTLLEGGSFFDHLDSFVMMRGGHLDLTVLGAMQVAANGDLANWSLGRKGEAPAVGGAMDLAVGAKKVFVTTDHMTKQGEPKIVAALSYPATGLKCVDRIYTDLCVIDVTPEGMKLIEKVQALSFEELQSLTGAKLIDATQG